LDERFVRLMSFTRHRSIPISTLRGEIATESTPKDSNKGIIV